MFHLTEYQLAQKKKLEILVRVQKKGPNDCWVYSFVNKYGYGVLGTSIEGKKLKLYIHRAILCLKLGRDIRKGYCACHTCDNPPCANPKHIWEGTRDDNNKDAKAKGRTNNRRHHLEKNGRSKLTREDIPQIRLRLDSGESMSSIGRSFMVSYVTIHRIRVGKSWSEF